MKKIIFIITKSNWGGAQRYVFDLATALPKDQFEVKVFFGSTGDPDASFGMLATNLSQKGVPSFWIKEFMRDISLRREWEVFQKLIEILRKEKPDIVHLNSSKAGGIGAVAARIAGVKNIIFTAHGWPFKEPRSVPWKIATYLLSWFTVLLSHSVIVVSKEDAALGKRMWFMERKIKYIPLALRNLTFLTKEDAEKIVLMPSDSGKIRLVTIAELTKNKGLHYGLDMIEELGKKFPEKYTYTIFGDGEERNYLLDRVNKLANPTSVHFVSVRPGSPSNLSTEASRYLKAFDIFVLPSIKEGMPYVLLEAAAADLPIVTTTIVQQEASRLQNIFFVPPGDGKALAAAVEDLVQQKLPQRQDPANSFKTMLAETTALYRA